MPARRRANDPPPPVPSESQGSAPPKASQEQGAGGRQTYSGWTLPCFFRSGLHTGPNRTGSDLTDTDAARIGRQNRLERQRAGERTKIFCLTASVSKNATPLESWPAEASQSITEGICALSAATVERVEEKLSADRQSVLSPSTPRARAVRWAAPRIPSFPPPSLPVLPVNPLSQRQNVIAMDTTDNAPLRHCLSAAADEMAIQILARNSREDVVMETNVGTTSRRPASTSGRQIRR
ncbi:hypothetical protein L1887_55729 [Cichorium endivia]|nr:hypothetical protein L1887_55729 [Cichorium endivia]